MSITIQLVVGLQNPGPDYAQTRHNAGSWVVQAFAMENNCTFKLDKKLQGYVTNLSKFSCKLFLPANFMNLNGQAVRAICSFYQIEPQNILVVHDDLDLAPGRIKLKTGGGHGGHNGLRDLIRHLHTENFHRLRIGIGHPGHKDQVSDYVLSKANNSEHKLLLDAVERAVVNMPLIISGQFGQAKSLLHVS
jgi:peptidyl-tRNA hydrolase, PTH1 family